MIRILIADDEVPAREKLERWVAEQPDMQVQACAEDGLTAAQRIEQLHPDVALLDIQMPSLGGFTMTACFALYEGCIRRFAALRLIFGMKATVRAVRRTAPPAQGYSA